MNELATIQPVSLDKLADAFYSSGLFPDIKSQAQAIVKIQAGSELGFAPIYSMQKVYIVSGKIVIAAEAMGALIKKSGKYNYRVKTYNDDAVALQFTVNGADEFLSAFSMTDARKAGLIKPGSGWEKFPRAMLMSKALSQGARIVCPEVIAGVYTFEDFGLEVNDDGDRLTEEAVKQQTEPPEPIQNANNSVKSPNLGVFPDEVVQTVTEKITKDQLKRVTELRQVGNIWAVARDVGIKAENINEWTAEEAQKVINVLGAK